MKKYLTLIMALAILFTLTVPRQTATAATITISKEKATMEVDSTLKLKVIGTSSKVAWITSEKAIGTVTSTGTVTAKKEGSTVITATVNGTNYTCTVTVVNSNKTSTEEKIYSLGETWTVDGFWTLTFNSVTSSDKRNQSSEHTSNQVLVLDYTIENLGYKSNILDLYASPDRIKVIDEKGDAGSTFPGDLIIYPKENSNGTKCIGGQETFGLDYVSTYITVYFEIYDNNQEKHNAIFKLKID